MSENQPNFESLRSLLALKRHETPPPGYFNNFSRQVMARIRVGEAETAASFSERLFAAMPWLPKLLQSLETKPVFAGGFAVAFCALLLFGVVIAQRPDTVSSALLQPGPTEVTSFASTTPTTPAALEQPVSQIINQTENSTNPVLNFQPPAAAPFGQFPVSAQFVNYSTGN